ncbi:helix-turn-helix transcriptional regulator [Paenibacillus pinihumi]|uniref:helix-turn-helix transcriptional regulator n=1 Tax=Paenibacillus pinihumi TaxID=669462 RepID=UPI00041EF2BD|nr:helix-turn-helix transcriptional regulator [Paenibacillus pinihumi]
MSGRYAEIEGVIAYIHQHIFDPLPLAKLAAYAAYSPYHFTRIFKERMGLSPHYYISALRLQKAKDLLLHTNMNIRDIGLEIGQQSLGTFTTRFTERVGLTPANFRNYRQQAGQHLSSLQQLTNWKEPELVLSPSLTVEGIIRAETPFQGVILIGLFARPIPEGLPLYGTLLSSLGDFRFTHVKPGTYYLMATTISWGTQAADIMLPQATLRTRSRTPIIVQPYTKVPPLDIMLYPPRLDDPPILISLPLLMNRFLSRVRQPAGC